MSKILEMRENRKKAWEAAKAFVETKRDKDGLLSAEDAKAYDVEEIQDFIANEYMDFVLSIQKDPN